MVMLTWCSKARPMIMCVMRAVASEAQVSGKPALLESRLEAGTTAWRQARLANIRQRSRQRRPGTWTKVLLWRMEGCLGVATRSSCPTTPEASLGRWRWCMRSATPLMREEITCCGLPTHIQTARERYEPPKKVPGPRPPADRPRTAITRGSLRIDLDRLGPNRTAAISFY